MQPTFPDQQTIDLTVVPPASGDAWWIATDHQRMKLTAANTGGALSLWFEMVPAGGGPPPHVHRDEDEVFIITSGEVTFTSGERTWVASPGTVVFAPRGVPHTFQNRTDALARMIILVTPGGLDRYFAQTGARHAGDETRPPIAPSEIDRLLTTGPAFGLSFVIGQ